jgi:hypothetical protein
MKKTFLSLAATAALLVGTSGAHALVLDFEDRPVVQTYLDVYSIFDFSPNGGTAVSNWFSTGEVLGGYYGGATPTIRLATPCGTNALPPTAACGTAGVMSDKVTASVPFTFNSVFMAGSDPAGPDDPNSLPLAVTLTLYDSTNSVVAIEPFSVNTGFGPSVQFDFAYTGLITGFAVTSKQGFYALDNFNITPVPEAGTLAMMLGGLAAVGAFARRRTAAK